MNTPLSYDEVRDLLPAYALGALDEQERAIVQSYLERYPELRAEATRFGAVAHGLAASVPQRVPPASLKAVLMAHAQARAAAQPEGSAWWDRLRDGLLAPGFVVRAAFALLLLVAGLLAAQTIHLNSQVAHLQREVAARDRLVRILSTGSEQVRLNGTEQAPQATATVRFNPDEKWAALETRNLPRLPESQGYQLWLVNAAGERWSGAVFNPNDSGSAAVLVWCPTPMSEIVRFGVSIEPAGGSPGPTGPAALRSVQS
jgi:anti-sigma-K factor RskA